MLKVTVQEIQDKEIWEKYISLLKKANFLQSWNWGEFQSALGKKIFRVAFFKQQEFAGAMLAIKERAKRGTYFTIAGGPLFINWKDEEIIFQCFSIIQELAKKEECLFIRFRPQEQYSPEIQILMKKLHAVESPMHLTADLTFQLDLTRSEQDLLSQMRKNTRYEIRRAEKEHITVSTSSNLDDMQIFYKHQQFLAQKHHFIPFSYRFLYKQFSVFSKDNQALLFHAHQKGELLASAFVMFYHQEAVYHYGISTEKNAKLPGAYACQWSAILEAKKRGCTWYNFWGITAKNQQKHRFSGVSLFKRGFGGVEVQYTPAHDIPLSPLYWITYIFESVRKKVRKL